MSRGDSILQTASMVRWVSAAVTAADHTIFNESAQAHVIPSYEDGPGGAHRRAPRPQPSTHARDDMLTSTGFMPPLMIHGVP